MQVLQAAGVAAAPIQDVEDQLNCNPQFEARGFFLTMEEPEMGPIVTEASPVKMSGTPPQIYRAAPLMGEHTESVLREILGLTDDEIAALTDEEVLH
jgi:crotonobetainyl-CoA:carnitine CoA-transferase CaiB-like acyl-CoA transferase